MAAEGTWGPSKAVRTEEPGAADGLMGLLTRTATVPGHWPALGAGAAESQAVGMRAKSLSTTGRAERSAH